MKLFHFFCIALFVIPGSYCRAEFPALEAAFESDIADISQLISGKSVLVSVDESFKMKIGWRLAAAIETEIVAQLISQGVSATDDDTDHRFKWLARDGKKDVDKWQRSPVYDCLLVGNLKAEDGKLIIELLVFNQS